MGLFSNFLDRFRAKDFSIAANKKIKTIQAEFKENFGLTLRVFKGVHHADGDLTIAKLNQKVSTKVDASKADLSIKASLTIDDFEKMLLDYFGLKVQVADEYDSYLLPNNYTLGQASRKEDLTDWCKEKGFASIEDWLKSHKCTSLDDYFKKKGKIK